jgi:NAD(P)-dependent dehydrogenase (short-subunit alcohol dehydrogenase family)
MLIHNFGAVDWRGRGNFGSKTEIGGRMASGAPCGVALVTGASRRIGRVIVERLAQEGYAVAVHASPHSKDEADRVAQGIAQNAGRAVAVSCDLAQSAKLDDLLAAVQDALGPVTLLVNNASIFEPDDVRNFDGAALDRHVAINLRAPIALASFFARRLPADREGCVINVIDQRVLTPGPDFFSYTLSKSALWTATRTMALAFAPRIRVNAVGPGPTLPNKTEGEDGFAREIAAAPLQRPVTPASIAEAVVYLAKAASVTGQMIAVDSGQHLRPTR